jgi:hypothetical protein
MRYKPTAQYKKHRKFTITITRRGEPSQRAAVCCELCELCHMPHVTASDRLTPQTSS